MPTTRLFHLLDNLSQICHNFGIATSLCKYIFIGAIKTFPWHTCTHHSPQNYKIQACGWASMVRDCCWRRSPWGSAPPARRPPSWQQPPRRGRGWGRGRPDPSLCSVWQNKQKSMLAPGRQNSSEASQSTRLSVVVILLFRLNATSLKYIFTGRKFCQEKSMVGKTLQSRQQYPNNIAFSILRSYFAALLWACSVRHNSSLHDKARNREPTLDKQFEPRHPLVASELAFEGKFRREEQWSLSCSRILLSS